MNRIKRIFGKQRNIIIGVVHFPPLPSYSAYPGFAVAKRNALADTRAFIKGGVDGIIFENNYDIPHTEFISPAGFNEMLKLGREIKKICRIPLGVNVLWNDYEASFRLAKELKLKFVRIPVFVDKVQTDYGIISGKAKKIKDFQKSISASDIALLADIHVKHSVLLSKRSLLGSAREAIKRRADGLIITGNWTGQAPEIGKLKSLRQGVGDFPIFIGSGTNSKNVRDLLKYTNGVIVSTSLKKGSGTKKEVNVKNYSQRIDVKKTKFLVENV